MKKHQTEAQRDVEVKIANEIPLLIFSSSRKPKTTSMIARLLAESIINW